MATIAEQLTSLANTKTAIKDAIVAKGVAVADADPFSAYPTKIGQISGGGATTKYGVSIDGLLGDVDAEGNYTVPTDMVTLDLSGVKNVPDYAFYAKFHRRTGAYLKKIIANDLIYAGSYAFYEAFRGQTQLEEPAIFGIEEVTLNNCFNYCFADAGPRTAIFRNLKKIAGTSSFANAFTDGPGLFGTFCPDFIFPVLEEIGGSSACSSIAPIKTGSPLYWSSIKTIVGSSAPYSSPMGGIYTADVKWYFPRATSFSAYVWNVSSSYRGEIHFAAANQAAIESCDGYDNKWGYAGATIYFDLMLSIVVDGVAYSRKHTIDGYTSWANEDGAIIYTDATAEPAVGTVVYSDQGATQVGTVSEVA